jgi:hypothetical protein
MKCADVSGSFLPRGSPLVGAAQASEPQMIQYWQCLFISLISEYL